MGATLGGVIGQTLGEQIGGSSVELLQIGSTSPLTHSQTQDALAILITPSATTHKTTFSFFILFR